MQGLRPFVQPQDENSVSYLQRGVTGKLVFGGESGFSKSTSAGLPGQRKALGFIGNREPAAQPSKTPGAAGLRRALGDITNNANNKQPVQQQRAPANEKPSGAVATAAKPASKAEAYAEGGVERLAGKGWRELERDRQERADAEIDQRLMAFAAMGKRSLPSFFPLWVSRGQ